MASQTERNCLSNPNFAVICSFMDRYAETLGLPEIGYKDLQEWVEDTKNVSLLLIDLHVRLLRRIHKKFSSVTADRWEKGVVKFCYKYSSVDAWEIERFGYKLAKISTKLTLLKNLMESQFDCNNKFKDKINETPIEDMRFQPVGRDKNGMAYWYFLDKELNLRVYREHQDDVDSESWELVCRSRDDLQKLITGLEYGTDIKLDKQESSDLSEAVSDVNEDSRDSFKQKTPLGPSPLTIKQEPVEGDSITVDSKQPLLLKISKSDTQSPSKMLKDKFVKEKGSEIQKIMCKMKQEGLVESDDGEEEVKFKDIDCKTDEVDGSVNKSEPSDKEKDSVKGETKEVEVETSFEKAKEDKMSKEVPVVMEGKRDIDIENKEQIPEAKKDDSETHEKKQTELKSQKQNEALEKTSEVEVNDSSEKQLVERDCNNDIQKTINGEALENHRSISVKTQEVDPSEVTDLKKDTDKNDLDTDFVHSETQKLTDSDENKTKKTPNSESSRAKTKINSENISPAEDDSKSLKPDLTSSDNDHNVSDQMGKGSSECDKSNGYESEQLSKTLVSESVEESDDTNTCIRDKSEKSERSESKTEQKLEEQNDCTNESEKINYVENLSESLSDEKCEKFFEKGSKEISSENLIYLKNKSEVKEKSEIESEHSCTNDQLVEQKQLCVSASLEDIENKSVGADIVKKARKRKNDDIKQDVANSSTDEEVDNESVIPNKRTTKTAVRKSPNNTIAEETKQGEDSVEENEKCRKTCDETEAEENKDISEISKLEINENEEIKTSEKSNEEEVTDKNEISEKKETVQKDESVETGDKDLKKGTEATEMKEKELESETAKDSMTKVKGLVAHSKRSKSKAQKRQAENSDDIEPVEPASKKSKLRGRVSSKGRGKSRGVNFDSSSSDDDIPLSQMAGRGRGTRTSGKLTQNVGKQQSKAIKDLPKKKKVVEEQKANDAEETLAELSEEDTGRRRSARVRSMRARKKKSPSPDYVPSEFEESEDEFIYNDDDDEFTLKSKKRKKKEPKEVIEELPKGRNALRHEAKTNKNGSKAVEEEEEEAACVKCLRSHQPEWILLCDKCDAGYHTACLRPPLMIIPDGDWFCPPCEHTQLKEKLEENLKSLDQAILKNDRLIRRKERLAFVSVSLDNVLKEPEPVEAKKGRKQKKLNYKESEEESESSAGSETGSSESTFESESSSEGERTHGQKAAKSKYIQRTCRTKQAVSYRFEEFDELIMDAIEEDLSIPKEPKPKKVKPPGISRGKDMSNILGVSDEETEKKAPRKRRPRLTELDEEMDDDDTDDYQLSEGSEASDMTKSYESEEVSEDSIGSAWRYNSRSTRKSRRKGGRNRKYRDDFVVDSDFESDEDTTRRSKRRTRRGKVNYKEINSDETEVEDDDESFHSSELSDSDFESKRKKRIEKKSKQTSKERPRSGKRQRIRRVSSSSESSETESDDSTPRKKIGKKPPSKSARYDSDESDQSVEESKEKKSRSKKVLKKSESDAEETEGSQSSETEVSESDEKKTKPKQKRKTVIRSESEGEEGDEHKDDVEKESENESHDSEDTEGSGWEEIGVESDEEKVKSPNRCRAEKSVTSKNKSKAKTFSAELSSSKGNLPHKKKPEESEVHVKADTADIKTTENILTDGKDLEKEQIEPTVSESFSETVSTEDTPKVEDKSLTDVTPTKKKRGRKNKVEQGDNESTTTKEVTPKKRGRKPKLKPETNESNVDEIPVKKKRGRNVKSDTADEVEHEENKLQRVKVETDEGVIVENKKPVMSEKKDEEKPEECQKEEILNEKTEATVEKNKDDSPLSARNKQNAPVGVVKPEVRQGVIVENKQVIDSRLNENRSGENTVNPLQGMRDLAMGNQNIPGSHQSSFTPYSQSNFSSQNITGYMGQPSFQSYPQQVPPYGQGGPGPNHPYPGPQSMAPGPSSQYPPNQGPMSPNSYQQHGSYMGQMQQGPPGFYPGNYRPPVGHSDGFGPPNSHGTPSPSFQHGQNPQYYHSHQTSYPGQGHGYPEHHGPFIGPQGHLPHPQGGPAPYPGMPYSYPNMPHQGLQRPSFGPHGPQNMSPNQPVRPQTRLAGPGSTQQGSSPNPRTESDPPNRGFMMDNILKPSPEGQSNDVEDSAEVSDIDRYTSFLCKNE